MVSFKDEYQHAKCVRGFVYKCKYNQGVSHAPSEPPLAQLKHHETQ
jgi:hypothetical protein